MACKVSKTKNSPRLIPQRPLHQRGRVRGGWGTHTHAEALMHTEQYTTVALFVRCELSVLCGFQLKTF